LQALKKLDIFKMDKLLAENPLNGVMITDKNFNPYVRFPTGGSSLVNRWKLRDLLLQDVHVEWNKRFMKYEETPDNVKIHFLDGTTFEADLLVGADGARSKVRQLYRPDLQFHTTGIGAIAGFFELNYENEGIDHLSELIKNNLVRVQLDHRHSLLCMRFIANNNMPHFLWAISYDKEHAEKLYGPLPSAEQPTELKKHLLQRVQDYTKEINIIISNTPSENIFLQKDYVSMVPNKNSHIRPSPPSTPFHHRVTLLGDAAHAMTSHAGLGANTAFKDAVDLADIIQHPKIGLYSSDWAKGHSNYEKEMFDRGYKAISLSLTNTHRIHSDPNEWSIRMLKAMGVVFKSYNYITTGKFSF
jgi:2-polyprenyl-6-methoxyphenol hydroxylase-like FAD-dependent oxidoreductase